MDQIQHSLGSINGVRTFISMHEKNKTEIHLGKLHRTIFPFSLECDEAEKKPLRQQLMALDDLLTTWAMYFPVYEADSVSPGKAVQCLQYSASNVGTSIIQQLFLQIFRKMSIKAFPQTWRMLSQYVTQTLVSTVPRKFHALHAAGFRGIKFLSRWRKISLP